LTQIYTHFYGLWKSYLYELYYESYRYIMTHTV